jgi:Tol biopolymer transport system component
MKLGRRHIVLLAGLVLVCLIAAAVVYAVARDENDLPRFSGRVAFRDGCGLRHMWGDGTDQREMCLPSVWAATSISRNGKKLAWDTGSGLSIADSDGNNSGLIPAPPGANFDPSLSPDADKVAFLHSPRDDGRYDVWVGSTSIDNAEQLTNTSDASSIAWSPDGDWIAYVKAWSEVTFEGDIMLIRPNGDDDTLLTRGDTPTWSPDGSRLAYAHRGGIWTIDADGSNEQMLIANGESPSWSRDGRQIAFTREVPCGKPVCRQRVFVVNAGGGEARGIGPTFDGPRAIVWLPDPHE